MRGKPHYQFPRAPARLRGAAFKVVVIIRRIFREGNKIIIEFSSETEAALFARLIGIGELEAQAVPRGGEEDRLQLSPLTIKVTWNEETKNKYINFLKHKPKKPVRDEDTINDYLLALEKFLECSSSTISPETIIKCVKNKHYSSALRNFLHMLHFYNEIDKNVYRDLLERIPSFNKDRGIAMDYVPISKVLLSLGSISTMKKSYRYLYHALFYSGGVRLEQLVKALENPSITYINRLYSRIKLQGEGTKTAAYAWLPNKLIEKLLKNKPEYKPKTIRSRFKKRGLVTPNLIRSFCWQAAKQILKEDLALLLQGRIGELKKRVTASSYDNLVYQLDQEYKKWYWFVRDLEEYATSNEKKAIVHAQIIKDKYRVVLPIA